MVHCTTGLTWAMGEAKEEGDDEIRMRIQGKSEDTWKKLSWRSHLKEVKEKLGKAREKHPK